MLSLIAGIVLVTLALSYIFSERNLLYIITSGSMSPTIKIDDLVVVDGLASVDTLMTGDIIVFQSPDMTSGVITHRIVEFVPSQDGHYVITKGDANLYSIPNVDYPITDKDLIGKVAFIIPGGGELVKSLRPPIGYIVILSIVTALSCSTILIHGRKDGMKFP
ncbi:signal peptidase I [Nitrososphaera sp.]|uniref:signal peptidase I n=1 Tax=Nitrososphaera sp. TaxID=1971748 RepID=UPI002EDB7DEF